MDEIAKPGLETSSQFSLRVIVLAATAATNNYTVCDVFTTRVYFLSVIKANTELNTGLAIYLTLNIL